MSLALLAALLLNAPLIIGYFHEPVPDWLDSAWQVSATLVGLGVALIILVLQAAASQSLRTEATYGALLTSTGFVWPAAQAGAFLAAVAVVERFASGTGTAPSWVLDLTVVSLLVQVALFGVTLERTLRLVSQQAVAHELAAAFRHAIGRSVESDIRQKLMWARLLEGCQEAGVSLGGFLDRGRRVAAGRHGSVVDVDRQLPSELKRSGLNASVTLVLEPGRVVEADSPIARVDGELSALIERVVRSGVVIRRSRGTWVDPGDVLGEVLDAGRAALADGASRGMRLAIQVASECMREPAIARRLWGQPYTAQAVGQGFRPATEDVLFRELAGFSDDCVRSGQQDAVDGITALAYDLVLFGMHTEAPSAGRAGHVSGATAGASCCRNL